MVKILFTRIPSIASTVHEADSQWHSGALASSALRWAMVKQLCHAGHTAQLKGGHWGDPEPLHYLIGPICLQHCSGK